MKNENFYMLAKTMFGLEEVLAKELEELGAQNVKINSEYSYLIIAKKNVFNDRFEDIKTELFLNFKKIK